LSVSQAFNLHTIGMNRSHAVGHDKIPSDALHLVGLMRIHIFSSTEENIATLKDA
jgi:hypothetical protein